MHGVNVDRVRYVLWRLKHKVDILMLALDVKCLNNLANCLLKDKDAWFLYKSLLLNAVVYSQISAQVHKVP